MLSRDYTTLDNEVLLILACCGTLSGMVRLPSLYRSNTCCAKLYAAKEQ